MNTGSAPTERHARTGELTPPGMTARARSKIDWLRWIDIAAERTADRAGGGGSAVYPGAAAIGTGGGDGEGDGDGGSAWRSASRSAAPAALELSWPTRSTIACAVSRWASSVRSTTRRRTVARSNALRDSAAVRFALR